jgi:hypothetical protein
MITKTFGAATQYSAPVFLSKDQRLAISISGTFVGTVAIQRLMQAELDYPLHSDAAWNTVDSYTAPVETRIADGDSCWYRAYCSVYSSGSPVAKLSTQ